MSIIGLTDRTILRRDGKIRAGKKEGTKLVNTEHFLLHDAPGLVDVLGEAPTEIYFTVHSDRPEDFMKTDLRWYNASQLLCLSMHNAPDEQGAPMGSVAAYFGVGGGDVSGLKQSQFPRVQKARTRVCNYKSCPDYVTGKCTEHMFLDVLVPQFSMGAVFTLDNTSINAILNCHSTFGKAWTRYGGKLSGQIFRMYKKPGEISYQKQDGSQGKRDAPMIYLDMVNFEEYEQKFKEKIRPEDWEALTNIRNRQAPPPALALGTATSQAMLPPPEDEDVRQLLTNEPAGEPSQPQVDPALLKRANDPTIIPLFNKLGELLGREATEQVRISTMMNIPSVKQGIEYLKGKIKEAEKAKAAKPAAQTQQPPAGAQQQGKASGDQQQTKSSGAPAGGLY